MTARKWLIAFFITVAAVCVILCAFNVITDPFGVFGDKVLDWYSYDMTNNPRAAKITYLDARHDEYDSYIIGCSSTSSFPTEAFGKYLDASFYNMIMYGADMQDCENEIGYMIKNYTVKNIVLNVYIDNAVFYGDEPNEYTHSMLPRTEGKNDLLYYLKYLFLNPEYGIAKIRSMSERSYLPHTYDVFNEKTGSYDKRRRDSEPISGLEAYLESYPVFGDYPSASYTMPAIEECVASVGRISEMCRENGVNLIVVTAPVYCDYMDYFSKESVKEFYGRLAEVTDYWDFSYSSVSFEPRYFYDETHFRNDVGTMAAARIFGDTGIYVPDDFGVYVTSENYKEHSAVYDSDHETGDISVDVPILMYHNVTPDGEGDMNISADELKAHFQMLKDNGFRVVTLEDLKRYVTEGKDLPEKPVVITFDDGYYGNYEYAYPLLSEFGYPATIFSIGAFVGSDTYKDTGEPIYDHIDENEMAEMVSSGLVTIGSHTYDMHQAEKYEGEGCRSTMAPLAGESENSYIEALSDDLEASRIQIAEATGSEPCMLSFPQGYYNEIVLAVSLENGFDVSVSTEWGKATVVRGLRQSLIGMKRLGTSELTADELLDRIK